MGRVFLIILTIVIGAQALFSVQLFATGTPAGITVAAVQLAAFLTGFMVMFMNFRRAQTTDYRKAFYGFGLMIAAGVPVIGYFVFGLLFLITGSTLIQQIGWGISGAILIAILYGIFRGRWNWKTHTIQLDFEHLPEDLNGLRIVQISDIHVGSFFNQTHRVQKAIDQINELKPDYVLFTGDLVNNITAEMHGWESTFRQIEATKGKFSILGNHDYGDYVPWEAELHKQENLKAIIEMHRSIGFTPLLNEQVKISEEGNGAYFVGVENWGKAPFRQSGNLGKAMDAIPEEAFTLLMSHDPSHFDEQVIGTGVDLTLSGHTHGMQFGIERFGIKFSPVQFRYKKWAGLYQVGKQYLYVNRGFGYIGFPGRVGIYPEITLIELRKN
ncbi:MAG TPA: metallophosphoesterase [Fluviicola sp.]|nr:metallophosphoesterase [Fluviicola sp.]